MRNRLYRIIYTHAFGDLPPYLVIAPDLATALEKAAAQVKAEGHAAGFEGTRVRSVEELDGTLVRSITRGYERRARVRY